MAIYAIRLDEIRHYDSVYQVEAESLTEALSKALSGDTVSESEGRLVGVISRDNAEAIEHGATHD